MKHVITRHAKRRMRQRGVSASRVSRGVRGKRKALGHNVYRAEVTQRGSTAVIIYKVVNGKKVILSMWRKK